MVTPSILERSDLGLLHGVLVRRGLRVIGPALREGTIVYDELASLDDLPAGYTDEQAGGSYRVTKGEGDRLFGYVVGPYSPKGYLHPSKVTLWEAARNGNGNGFRLAEPEAPGPVALFGVRPCELAAIAVQDRVFLGGEHHDAPYDRRRDGAFLVAVNCVTPGGTCFCTSMGTGPEAREGYDLALTEMYGDDAHRFLVEAGTEAGAEVLAELPTRPASDDEIASARGLLAEAAQHMGRTMDTTEIKDLLQRNLEHPQWDEVARRCLTCGNCTMVCPTCFCTTVTDEIDLDGAAARRVRRWDSCFSEEFSYIHGGAHRTSVTSRYRQWMTHKLASWWDQFGSSGCVGCGRCITWCPVGIDITEEVRAIRETEEVARVRSRSTP